MWLVEGRVTRNQEGGVGGSSWLLFGGNYLENCRILVSVNVIKKSDMPSSRQKQLSVVV